MRLWLFGLHPSVHLFGYFVCQIQLSSSLNKADSDDVHMVGGGDWRVVQSVSEPHICSGSDHTSTLQTLM